ncbi:hypothetical protein A8926_1950 [Saccharopolyspora spinosa]|uniref:Uncharacterized protein n=4 Tax=Saccharopolyspora spinosa TaxID=60894 RepID=A0A2N3XUP4_SACSN|nr:hypothetical protein A8926_1950 [Saccharopolyspora spinosa]
MGQSTPVGPQPVQQPPTNQYPATRVQQHLDAEQPEPFRDPGTLRDPDADRYRDPYQDRYRDDPYDDRHRDPYHDRYPDPEPYDDRYRDDPYDDRYRERDRHRDPDPYPDRHRDRDYDDRRSRGVRFRGPSADTIGRLIQVLTALISLVFVLHIIFVLTGANQDNDFVAFTYGTAKFFVLGLGDVFTPGDATIGVILNYGLAALIYLFAGRIVARALKR